MRKRQTSIRILICSPVDGILGGIPAAVATLIRGLSERHEIVVRRMPYAILGRHRSRLSRFLREIAQIPVFMATCLEFAPDIVQIETSVDKKTLVRDSVFIAIARVLRLRIILRSHGGVFDQIPQWPFPWRCLAKAVLRASDRVVLLARETQLDFEGFMGDGERAIVIPNAIESSDSTELGPVPAPRPEGRLRLVTAGRLIATKGVEDAVIALSHVRNPNVTFTIFGDGPSAPEIRRRIAELELGDRVFLRGAVAEGDLPPFYKNEADVFVFPSFHREGFPMAFFTALACGLGAITTQVRPLPDYLVEPTNCCWIQPCDPVGLAGRIDYLCANPGLLAAQRHANAILARQFRPECVASSFLRLYHQLMQPGASPPLERH